MDKIEEKALYISKLNYESEYKTYMEIWDKLVMCVENTQYLFPRGIENVPVDEKEREEYNKNKYNTFYNSYKDFSKSIEKYAPFYNENFYNKLCELKRLCYEIGSTFYTYEFDVKYNLSFSSCRDLNISSDERRAVHDNQEQIDSIKDELLKEIRGYLNSLKL